MARKNIFSDAPAVPPRDAAKPRAASPMPRGAVGALQSSLARMQESAVQEVDPSLIDEGGVTDRLGPDDAAQAQLAASIKAYGQQVPVLLRPHPEAQGRFQIVYGRRRLRALRGLGQPVKALVRQLDDHALVMAQGQENSARQELSFIERASFAAQLEAAGYPRQSIADALSIDLPMVSRMLKVGAAFELSFLRQIGRAPSIGRPRWLALAQAMERPGASNRVHSLMQGPDFALLASDDRFEAVLKRAGSDAAAAPKPPAPQARHLPGADGVPLAEIKRSARALQLSVPQRGAKGFDDWLEAHAAAIVQELHARFHQEQAEETPQQDRRHD